MKVISSFLQTRSKDNKKMRGKNMKEIENLFLNYGKLWFLITLETK